MINILPDSPHEATRTPTPAPYADAVARLNAVARMIEATRQTYALPEHDLTIAWEMAGDRDRAILEARAEEVAAAAAVGLAGLSTL